MNNTYRGVLSTWTNGHTWIYVALVAMLGVGCGAAPTMLLPPGAPANEPQWVPRTEQDFLREPVRTDDTDEMDVGTCRRAVPHPTEHVDEYMACLKTRRSVRAKAEVERQAKAREEADRRYEEGAAARQAERDREEEARTREAAIRDGERKREEEKTEAVRRAETAADRAAVNAIKNRCGDDYMRVEVGMLFARVKECAGHFRIKIDDPDFQVYEGIGGLVTVQNGVVRRVVRK